MKRLAIVGVYLWVTGILAFAQDARIEEVMTFVNRSKSSVVINYTGVERLRFFAIDTDDGLLTMDFPGVYSDFDFSTLSFAQVSKVQANPLDPDNSKGISVRFFLAEGVKYDVFDQGDGELTLFFETVESEAVASNGDGTDSETVAASPVSAPPVQLLDGPGMFYEIKGNDGDHRFSEMSLYSEAFQGRMLLKVDALEKFKSFRLEEPKRYVLDLYQTVASLEKNDLLVDSPLIQNIRVRQFQSQPEPITRMVLDLRRDVAVELTALDQGLLVAFAVDQDKLAGMMQQLETGDTVAKVDASPAADVTPEQEPMTEPGETVVASLPEEALVSEDAVVVTQPGNSVDAKLEAFEGASDEPSSDVVAEKEPVATVEPKTEAADISEPEAPVVDAPIESVETPVENKPEEAAVVVDEPEAKEDLAAVEPEPETPAEVKPQAEPVEEAEPLAETSQEAPSVANETVNNDQPEEIVTQVEDKPAVSAPEPVKETPVTEVAEPELVEESLVNEPVIEKPKDEVVAQPVVVVKDEPAEVTPEPQPAPEAEAEIAEQELPKSEETKPEPISEPEDVPVTSEPIEAVDPVVEEQSWNEDVKPTSEASSLSDLELPTPGPEESIQPGSGVVKVPAKGDWTVEVVAPELEEPGFSMASDLDLEMSQFLENEEQDDSIYGMMKGVRSNRKIPERVVVTNSAIEKSKLSEARSMQDEEVEPENFSELFRNASEDEFGVETIDSGQREYQGFEISSIDVKDADVVDLLRFIADQVGINLYVDSSVRDLYATYKFRNIPWDQALDIILSNANLDKEFRNGVLRVATTEKFELEERSRAALRDQRELNVPLETVTFTLNYANASEVEALVEQYLSVRGIVQVDARTNMLIIQDIPRSMTTIRALIKKLDRMIEQVTIEARLVETTKRFLKELGIQWGLSAQYSPETGTETGVEFPNRIGVGGPVIGGSTAAGLSGGYAVNFPIVSENPSGFGLSLGNFLDNFKLDISLQMLETEGFGQIISSPKITTQNNMTALIKTGQQVPIQTINRGTISTRYIDAVLQLSVTPHITSDETVILELLVDKSELDFTRVVLGNPVINVREARTKVLVKNGGTAVIGGIFQLNEQRNDSGLPALRKIPIVKRLFGSEQYQYENQELLIFVTPRIVKY